MFTLQLFTLKSGPSNKHGTVSQKRLNGEKDVGKIVTIKDGKRTHKVKITKIGNKQDCIENEKAMEESITMIHGESPMLTEEIHDQDETFQPDS